MTVATMAVLLRTAPRSHPAYRAFVCDFCSYHGPDRMVFTIDGAIGHCCTRECSLAFLAVQALLSGGKK